MSTQPDFEELLRLLEENRVSYMVVGGYAVAFYGYPRFTKDIDIFFQVSTENLEKLQNALVAFGFPRESIPQNLFTEKGNIIKFGIEPIRIDLLNEIDGVAFEEIVSRIERGKYGNVEISFIGKNDLIRNKKASNRDQDKIDVAKLSCD